MRGSWSQHPIASRILVLCPNLECFLGNLGKTRKDCAVKDKGSPGFESVREGFDALGALIRPGHDGLLARFAKDGAYSVQRARLATVSDGCAPERTPSRPNSKLSSRSQGGAGGRRGAQEAVHPWNLASEV